jgi:hypothetical protein
MQVFCGFIKFVKSVFQCCGSMKFGTDPDPRIHTPD